MYRIVTTAPQTALEPLCLAVSDEADATGKHIRVAHVATLAKAISVCLDCARWGYTAGYEKMAECNCGAIGKPKWHDEGCVVKPEGGWED